MAQSQQLGTIAPELACQAIGGHALGETTHDQYQLRAGEPQALQGGAREGIEDPATVPTLIINNGVAVPAMDAKAFASSTRGAMQAVGVQPSHEPLVAGLFIHELADGEIHGSPPCRQVMVNFPQYSWIS
jgi:hypothetical protein